MNDEASSEAAVVKQYEPNFEKSQLGLSKIDERSIEQSMSTVSKLTTRFNNETINSKIIFRENLRGSTATKNIDII